MKETINGAPVKREGKARADWVVDKTRVRGSVMWAEQPRKPNSKCVVCVDAEIIKRSPAVQKLADIQGPRL